MDLFEKLGINPLQDSLQQGSKNIGSVYNNQSDSAQGVPPDQEKQQLEAVLKKHPILGRIMLNMSQHSPGLVNLLTKSGQALQPVKEFSESTLGLPRFGANIAEGMVNPLISAANLVPHLMGSESKIPHLNVSERMPETGILGEGLGLLGNLGGMVATGAGLSKLAPAFMSVRPSGYSGILTDILKGAGTGYAFGENKEGGGRGLGAAIGGALGLGANLLPSRTSKLIEEGSKEARKSGSKLYNQVFDTAKKVGASDIKNLPNVDIKPVLDGATKTYSKSLKNLYSNPNPTLRDMHETASDLGKMINKYKNSVLGGTADNAKIKAYDQAIKIQELLRKKILGTLSQSSNPSLAKKYMEATKFWAEDVMPYQTSKILKSKVITPQRSKEIAIESKFPQDKLKQALIGTGVLGGLGSAVGYGRHGLNKLLGEE